VSSRLATAITLAWLGAALLAAAVVAPAAFAVLPTRTLAGALVGRVLAVLFWAGAGAGVLVLAAGARGLRRVLALILLAASLGSELAVTPAIERVRRSSAVPMEALDATDPRRAAFGRLHGVSVLLLGLGMVAAAIIAALDLARARGSASGAARAAGPPGSA
jgi:Domain of unknown function (DUF4149)